MSYFQGLFSIILLWWLLSLPALFFQFKAGEFLSPHEIAINLLKTDGCIAQTKTAGIEPRFIKKELADIARPETIVIGPGTANAFNKDMFNGRFVNLGQSLSGPPNFIDDYKFHTGIAKPRLVILVVHPWWFNKKYNLSTKQSTSFLKRYESIFRKMYQPYISLISGEISLDDFLLVVGRDHVCPIGIRAIFEKKHGLMSDGSWHHGKEYLEPYLGYERQGNELVRSIEFNLNRNISKSNVQAFRLFAEDVFGRNNRLLIIFPPYSPSVFKAMQEEASVDVEAYIRALSFELGDEIVERTLFALDPSLIATSDCEFIGDLNFGDVVAARLLLKSLERWPDLHSDIDAKSLEAIVQIHHSQVTSKSIKEFETTQHQTIVINPSCR